MLHYKIVHHVHGRIRLQVPVLKKLSSSDLMKLWKLFKPSETESSPVSEKNLSELSLSDLRETAGDLVPSGITDIRANPLTGSLVIHYDPKIIDIMHYLEQLSANRKLNELIKKWE